MNGVFVRTGLISSKKLDGEGLDNGAVPRLAARWHIMHDKKSNDAGLKRKNKEDWQP